MAPLESSNLASSNSDVSVHNSSVTHTIYEDTDVSVEGRTGRFANVSKTESIGLDSFDRAEVGWRVKRIFNEGRVSHLINHDERPKSYLLSLVDSHGILIKVILPIIGEVREGRVGTEKRKAR